MILITKEPAYIEPYFGRKGVFTRMYLVTDENWELGKKYDFEDYKFSYRGIMPISQIKKQGAFQFLECVVDSVKKNHET